MLWLLALGPRADAAAYYFADAGVRSLGRGTAIVAGVDDLSAQYYNPAALTRIQGGMAKADLSFVAQRVRFDRADEPGAGQDGADLIFDEVSNQAPSYKIPSVGVAGSFGLDNWTFALGLYPPYAPKIEYPEDGPQRYSLVRSTLLQTTVGPSAAWRPLPWLSVGAGLQWNLFTVEQRLYVTTLDDDDPDNQIGFEVAAMDPFTLSGNVGVLVEPESGFLAVGLGVQPPMTFEATGRMEGDFSNHWAYDKGLVVDPKPSDEDILLTLTMPLQIKGGALVRPIEGLEIELGGVWQDWRSFDEIVVSEVELEVETDPDNVFAPEEPIVITDDIVLPAGYNAAWSVRLGAEYDLPRYLTVRAGGLYETSAIPEDTQSVQMADGPKFGYGTGLTAWLGRNWAVDVAWAQSFIVPRTITDSQVTQIQLGLLDGEVSEGKVVGNGEFRARQDFLGVGLQYVWGDSTRETPFSGR